MQKTFSTLIQTTRTGCWETAKMMGFMNLCDFSILEGYLRRYEEGWGAHQNDTGSNTSPDQFEKKKILFDFFRKKRRKSF